MTAMLVLTARSSAADARIDPAATRALAEQGRRADLVRQDLLEMELERPVARQQVVEVTVEETVLPDLLEQQVQKQPDVLHVRLTVGGNRENAFDFPLECRENGLDDLVLVVEVVIEIARTDVQVVGDDRGS